MQAGYLFLSFASLLAMTSADNVSWNATIFTSDVRFGGTDANVYLQLFGEEGQTRSVLVDTPGRDNHERDRVELVNRNTTNKYTFIANRWLDEDEVDGQTFV